MVGNYKTACSKNKTNYVSNLMDISKLPDKLLSCEITELIFCNPKCLKTSSESCIMLLKRIDWSYDSLRRIKDERKTNC